MHFSGHLDQQLKTCRLSQAAGRKVAVVKSSVDTRYHATRVVSHDGKSKVSPLLSNGIQQRKRTYWCHLECGDAPWTELPCMCGQVCFAASNLGELRSQLGDKYLEYNVIAIDEAQFLPDLLEFCTTAADLDHKQIVIAGLDGDFKRQRFGQVRFPSCANSLKLSRQPLLLPLELALS